MVTLKKLLYLIAVPISMIMIDLEIIAANTGHLGIYTYILLGLLHIGIILGMYGAYLYRPDYEFHWHLERMPMNCFGLGFDDGVVYIILPFITIAFGWYCKKDIL